MELWVVQEQLAFAILAMKYHVGNSCWSSGSLLTCSAKSPQFSHSVQIPHFSFSFDIPSLHLHQHIQVLEMCAIFPVHTDPQHPLSSPIFI